MMSLPALLTVMVCILSVIAVDKKGKEKAVKDVTTVQKAGKGGMTEEKARKVEMTEEKAKNGEMTDQKLGDEMNTGEDTVEKLEKMMMDANEEKTTVTEEESNPVVLRPMQIEIFNQMVKDKYGVAETHGCNSPEALDIIKDHIVKDKVTDLLAGKTYTDVWRREICTSFMSCVLTKFTMKDGVLVNEVVAVRTDQSNTFEEKWTETEVHGVFKVNGVWHNEEAKNPTFTDTLRFFYVDDNVIGTYTCREEGMFSKSNVWMVAISVVQDKVDTEEIKESLKKAEEEMKKIRELSGEMDKLKRENCPDNI